MILRNVVYWRKKLGDQTVVPTCVVLVFNEQKVIALVLETKPQSIILCALLKIKGRTL